MGRQLQAIRGHHIYTKSIVEFNRKIKHKRRVSYRSILSNTDCKFKCFKEWKLQLIQEGRLTECFAASSLTLAISTYKYATSPEWEDCEIPVVQRNLFESGIAPHGVHERANLVRTIQEGIRYHSVATGILHVIRATSAAGV